MTNNLTIRRVLPFAAALWTISVSCRSLHGQASVLTWHNDNFRTGQNLQETILTPANVNSTNFGKLFTLSVDGRVDAEPLYVPSVSIPNQGIHNVLFVVTEHDSVYAFDADTGAPLWQTSLLLSNEIPSDDRNCGQVSPEIGITSTPVIDLQMGPHGTMYVVAMSKNGSTYHQRLWALDIATKAPEFGSPMEVQATFPKSSGTTTFDPKQYKERSALLLYNGTVYTSWASHCDIQPYSAWIIGYNEANLSQVSVLDLTPNGSEGSIWQAGAGPAADANGNIFVLLANGTFDTTLNQQGFPSSGDYGNGFVKIKTGGTSVADYFTMSNTVQESNADEDLGSGGAMLLPTLSDTHQQPVDLAVGAGKDGNVYVVNQAAMGKFNMNSNAIYQELASAVGSVFSSPAWYNGTLYYCGSGDMLKAFAFSGGMFGTTPASHSSHSFPYPGSTPSVSANGTSNGIVWAAENGGTAVLHAYNASNLATELYNTNQAANGRDNFGAGNKYIVPMVVNGKVYVGTTNGVGAFGLFCGVASVPAPVNNAAGVQTNATLSWTAASGATSYDVALSTSNPPGIVASGLNTTSYTIPQALAPGTKYYWYVVTHNCSGTSQSQTWSFTTTANEPPSAVSVTPSSGTGFSQTFSALFSDPNGFQDLSSTYLLVGATLNFQGACYAYYDRTGNALWLRDDAGSSWLGPLTPGVSGTVQNSQCAISGSASSVSGAGNNLTVNLHLAFTPAFTGSKNVYGNAQDSGGLSSNFQPLGTWTVPSIPATAQLFVPIAPCRVADTRNTPNGPFAGPALAAKTTRDFIIPNSACGIPSNATAYSLNVAVVPSAALGFLTVWPSGQPQPLASTLNSLDGRIKANAAIVPAGTGGAVSFYPNAATDLVLDIDGYFLPAGVSQNALAFYPLTPCRIADTRVAGPSGLGSPSLAANQSRTFPLRSGSCNIPASAQAYSLNFTAVPPGSLGFMTAWPTGQPQPLASVLNDVTGTVVANAAIIPAGTNGSVDVFPNGATDLIIDINGYFAAPGAGGLSLYNLTPCRVLDTRLPAGSQPFKGELDVSVTGSGCGMPAAARAFVLNATVVPPASMGFLTLWPQGTTRPIVSTLNALDGQITSNMAIVASTNGSAAAYANALTHLILDVFGYFAP